MEDSSSGLNCYFGLSAAIRCGRIECRLLYGSSQAALFAPLFKRVGHQVACRDGNGLFRAAFNKLIPQATGNEFPVAGTDEF